MSMKHYRKRISIGYMISAADQYFVFKPANSWKDTCLGL
jgi:hypothetical protein